MFVASRQKTITALLGIGILFSVHIGRYKYGLPIPNGFCTVRSEIVFAERGIVQPFFCTSYFNHSYMAKTMKDCRPRDHSALTATLPHVTGKSYYHRYRSEARAKNQAYAFILSQGLLSEFIRFSRTRKSNIETVKRRIDLILERATREVNRDFNAKQSDL